LPEKVDARISASWALPVGRKLEWNGEQMKATNCEKDAAPYELLFDYTSPSRAIRCAHARDTPQHKE
jgi:hypothetical protein